MITMHFGFGSVLDIDEDLKSGFQPQPVKYEFSEQTSNTLHHINSAISFHWISLRFEGQADLWNIIRIAPNLASARLRTELWASFNPWNKLGTGRPTQSFQVTWPKLCECDVCQGGLSIRKLWGNLALFWPSLRNNSLQNWGSNKAILFPNRSLNFYITPSWELRSGNETCGSSTFFVIMWSVNNFDHF